MTPRSDLPPHDLSLAQVFLTFFRFGWLAFGGPVAQIAMIRQALVEDARWIAPARFNRLLAVMQVLPGPEAHELSVHLGMVARGRWGGVLAGLGFMLPGFLLMLGCAWAYVAFVAGRPELAAPLLGVQVVVLALIARAVQRIGGYILVDPTLIVLAGVTFVATLAGVPFWVPLAAGGLAYALALRPAAAGALAGVLSALAWWATGADGVTTVLPVMPEPVSISALFVAGLKGGLLTFGGAYTAIPYVRADTVGRGWLSDGTFLDGVAVAGVLPAPLVIFATFAGYVAAGWSGALAITAGMFLPAFAFSLIFFERLEQIVDHPRLHRLLDGVAAAVIGIIAATAVQLLLATAVRAPALGPLLPILATGFLIAWKWKSRWSAPSVIAFGAVAGALLFR
jgi:chromate transporter